MAAPPHTMTSIPPPPPINSSAFNTSRMTPIPDSRSGTTCKQYSRIRSPNGGVSKPAPKGDGALPAECCPAAGVLRKAGQLHDLQLIVLAPTPYRLSQHSKLLYRQPAYLICTGPEATLIEGGPFGPP